jgi:hypothetical protein
VEAEIVVVKLVGGTDRNRGRDKWMEHGHIGRREYKWGRSGGGRDPPREHRHVARRCRKASGARWTGAARTESVPRAGNAGGSVRNRSVTELQSRWTPGTGSHREI